MNKSLYSQLDHLIQTMPDLAAFTLPREALAWVGQAQGLVYALMGDSKEVKELQEASGRLGSIAYRWEAAQQIVAIINRVRTRARSVVRRQVPDWTHDCKTENCSLFSRSSTVRLTEVLVEAGSAAAHRAWKPIHDQLAAMMDALESFLKRAFLTNRKMRALKGAVPPRR